MIALDIPNPAMDTTPDHGSNASNTNDEGYTMLQLQQLVEFLKHEEPEARLQSMREIVTIASAIGPERTRAELLPYLADSVDDEDEIMDVLCEQLAHFIPLVGGAAHAYHLLPIYEGLACGEETVLRKKAADGMCSLASVMSGEHVNIHLMTVIRRLASGLWYAQRSTVCALIHVAFPLVTLESKTQLLSIMNTLSQDASVMVRRSVAEELKSLIPVLTPEVIGKEISPIFQRLAQDEQDSVRMLVVPLCVPLTKIEAFNTFVGDEAWRVRYVAANSLTELQAAVTPEVAREALLPAFIRLLQDPEAEVRTAVAFKVLEFCKNFAPPLQQGILREVIPHLQARVVDDSQHVRSALASVIMGLSELLGKESTIEFLLPLFLQLLKDEFSEVRLNIISNLDEVNKVVGIGQLSEALQPAINELAAHTAWRVRLAIIEHIPLVSKQLGVEFFDRELRELCMTWLGDKVFSVRRAAVQNLKNVIQVFGVEWAKVSIWPHVLKMAQESNSYSGRLTSVFTIDSLIDICGADVIAFTLVPVLCGLYADKVANIRFNVASTLEKALPRINKETYEKQVKGILETMSRDSDGDVQYHAKRALAVASSLNYI
eukprot:m.336357 g.336357  ORF g.336357 m.336357 type:complete len:603 (+) comp17826_c0_seq1:150-1958(+)